MPYIGDIFLGQGVSEPYRSNRANITDNNMVGCTTPEPLSASTKKLFDAIYDENLEAFKQALADGADVNAFDEEGMTPLMSIANAYIASNNQPTLERMAKLLIQNSNIDINAQSKQPVYEERQKKDQRGRLIYLLCGREVVEAQPGWYRYCDNDQLVDNVDDQGERRYLSSHYEGVKEQVRTYLTQKNTALHIACQVAAKDMVKILLTHPDVETDVKNCNRKSPEDCISRGFEDTIKLEFKKAQKGKQLLDALSNRDIYRAKILLNQELNPNCWRRNQNGEIETPLSLIIKSCLQTITRDKEEVLTKLLKHKELDFSQIKPIPAIEQSIQLKRIIEQAIKGRLIDTINKKDLDDVKKLVEDNCFMSYAIIAAALRDVGDPIKSITDYLNKKFPASLGRPLAGMNDIPVGFEKFVQELVDGLEKAKAQLAKKEKELSDARQELNKRNDKIGKQQNRISELERELDQTKAQLTEKDRELNNTREESRIHRIGIGKESDGRAVSPNRKQNNYALTFFILCGICTGGACLTIVDYPEVSAGLAAVALGLFLVGYFLYKGDEKDIGPVSTTDSPQVTRIFISSPDSAESFYTY